MTKEEKLEIVQDAIEELKIYMIEFPQSTWFMCSALRWAKYKLNGCPNNVALLFPEFVALGEQYRYDTWHGGWKTIELNGEVLDLDYPKEDEDRTPIYYQNRLKILEWLYDEVSKS